MANTDERYSRAEQLRAILISSARWGAAVRKLPMQKIARMDPLDLNDCDETEALAIAEWADGRAADVMPPRLARYIETVKAQ